MEETITLALCAGAIMFAFFAVATLVGAEKRKSNVSEQLRIFARSDEEPSAVERLTERVERTTWSKKFSNRLAQADLNLSPATYIGILFGIGILYAAALWLFFAPPLVITVVLAVALTWITSKFFLDARRDRYISELANQMPDVATLVSNSLKANLSIVSAFNVVAEKMPRPAGVEFARVVQQLHLGAPFDDAIHEMMDRLPCEELSLLLTTISIQRKAGGNLAAALSVVSTAITGRHRVRNEIATLTAEARYTSLIILALPVVMLALLNQVLPGSVTALLGNPLGWFLIAFFIAVQMVAFIAISRIARVRV